MGRATYRGYGDGAEREVMTGENGRRRRGAARRQGSDLQLSAWQEGAALKTMSLGAQCSEGVTTPCLQRREFGKRLHHIGGTGTQTRPQIHRPPTYSARPPCMHQRTHRLQNQAPRRCQHPSPVWLYVDLRKASTHWGFLKS